MAREETLNTAVKRAWAAPPTRYGTAMLRRFGWFYYALGFGWMFDRIRLEDHSVDRIRTAASRGPVVYVLPRRNAIDHLVLNTVLNRRRLPLSVWANGATAFFWQPVAAAWRDLLHRVRSFIRDGPAPDPIESGWVLSRLRHGEAITVFLDDRPSWWRRLLGREKPDVLDVLLKAQAQLDEPIQLVPAVVVWSRAPDLAGSSVRHFLTGARESEGPISWAARIYLRSRDTFVQVGDAVGLREFNERVSKERRSPVLHAVLRRYLAREAKVVRGPALLPRAVMKQLVLDNPPMRELARREALALGLRYDAVRKRMSSEFDAISAHFSWTFIRVLSIVLRPLWTRVFSGVDARPEDVEHIRTAMRDGSAILIPCHKSHLDYVLLSWVLFSHDLIVPHVIAGNNLAIWPLSIALRSAGGFFIKRSFGVERIHPAVFSRYVREMVRQGYPIEFFIEGARTRSGKLMRPKVGVLGMVLDAAELRSTGREVTLLPIALAYERVAEERAYARELGGEKKKPETMSAFFKSTAIIRRRFGRVYLRVGTPIPCSELVDEQPGRPGWSDRPEAARKELLHRVGERVIHRIGEVMVVLPSSLVSAALLSHPRRGIQHDDLMARALRYRVFLQQRGALEAASLGRWDRAVQTTLDQLARSRHIERLEHDGGDVWSVVPDQRIYLAFHCNQVMHFFAPACLAAAALRAAGDGPTTAEALEATFVLLVWTLRREFVFDPDRPASALLSEGLDHLVAHGAIARGEDDTIEVTDTGRAGEIYSLMRPLLESYALVLGEGRQLQRGPIETRDWIRSLQADRDVLIATGRISRPEALSMVNLQNAVNSFVEEGILKRTDDGLHDHPEAREARLARLAGVVD